MGSTFKTGMRVVVSRFRDKQIGRAGTILSINDGYLRIAFDNPDYNNPNHETNGIQEVCCDALEGPSHLTDTAHYYAAITGE